MTDLTLSEAERSLLRDATMARARAQQAVSEALAQASAAAARMEGAVDAVVRLRGLVPSRYAIAFDLEKDIFELRENAPVLPSVEEPEADQAGDPEAYPDHA